MTPRRDGLVSGAVERSKWDPWVLDVLYPYAGPCAICGGPDKRHRLADAIVENVRAGDDPEAVADNYDVPLATVERLVEVWR